MMISRNLPSMKRQSVQGAHLDSQLGRSSYVCLKAVTDHHCLRWSSTELLQRQLVDSWIWFNEPAIAGEEGDIKQRIKLKGEERTLVGCGKVGNDGGEKPLLSELFKCWNRVREQPYMVEVVLECCVELRQIRWSWLVDAFCKIFQRSMIGGQSDSDR